MRDGLSASDVALLSGRGNAMEDGFGGGYGAWWIIIFVLFFAFGNRGFGYGNEGSSMGTDGIATMYTLNSDFATLQRLNESGFDRLGTAINQVNNGLCQGFYQELVNFNNLGSQLASCCCNIRQEIASTSCATQRAIDSVNYNNVINTNSIQSALCNSTRDIVESQNCGTRAILDAITANRIEDKNAQIAAQQNEINALRLSASQSAQNQYLVEQLSPKCPIPAFLTCNPYTGQTYTNGFGYSNCGCGNY